MIDTLFPKSLFHQKILVLPNIHAGFATFQKSCFLTPLKNYFFHGLQRQISIRMKCEFSGI